ncbi:PREDICTED: uncharacterized protein LOC108662452 [Theobroma cacao]|uniref:Uncharacterized protein LOC108662452 n=1 Tax=Theobroma cacao TaxID=3641 RepID=A0AB32WEM4_THECC|nr:PREDICTED: uncharacterized protein LOC108662452 [Theobroma cacao]
MGDTMKKNRNDGPIFKVGFEKAFDSVAWEFLNYVMTTMGFGCRCCMWIQACINIAFIFALVNGSFPRNMAIGRGLRQDYPLSPILFNLMVKVFSLMMYKVINSQLVKGVESVVEAWADQINCKASKLPSIYLGLPLRFKQNSINIWQLVVQRFESKLAL